VAIASSCQADRSARNGRKCGNARELSAPGSHFEGGSKARPQSRSIGDKPMRSSASVLTAAYATRFMQQCPGVSLKVSEAVSSALRDQMLSGSLDLSIVPFEDAPLTRQRRVRRRREQRCRQGKAMTVRQLNALINDQLVGHLRDENDLWQFEDADAWRNSPTAFDRERSAPGNGDRGARTGWHARRTSDSSRQDHRGHRSRGRSRCRCVARPRSGAVADRK
jgi:hypothetical protein